jgi:hypothetical protein
MGLGCSDKLDVSIRLRDLVEEQFRKLDLIKPPIAVLFFTLLRLVNCRFFLFQFLILSLQLPPIFSTFLLPLVNLCFQLLNRILPGL